MGYYVGYEPYKPTYHHNARPPVKVRKHERRERSAFKQSQRAWASRTFGQFVPCIPNQYPEPDGA